VNVVEPRLFLSAPLLLIAAAHSRDRRGPAPLLALVLRLRAATLGALVLLLVLLVSHSLRWQNPYTDARASALPPDFAGGSRSINDRENRKDTYLTPN
jgi:hypothetical protein